MSITDRYAQRGVSASKSEVHEAVKNLDKGLFPSAFCKILPDFTGKEDTFCNIIHADTAGTKPSLAYVYWRETGDISVWRGIAQDALVMNLDDMACVGMVNDFVLSSTIGRNKNLIPGAVIKEIIDATQEFISLMNEHKVQIHHGGGETADVGDIVRTIDVGFTVYGRMPKASLIVNNIKPGAFIIGVSSYGQATYETSYNGGMGSNGLTSARHDVFSSIYKDKYPESFDPLVPNELVYSGTRSMTDEIEIDGQVIRLGKLVLSPTRTFLPILRSIIPEYKSSIQGIIHNTGGAHYKVLNFVENVKIIKDNLLDIPPLFNIIQKESGTSWEEMFKVFNMGTRLELYVDEKEAHNMIEQIQSFGIHAQVIGRVEHKENGKEVSIEHATLKTV